MMAALVKILEMCALVGKALVVALVILFAAEFGKGTRFRYSMRALLLAMTVIAIALGLVTYRLGR